MDIKLIAIKFFVLWIVFTAIIATLRHIVHLEQNLYKKNRNVNIVHIVVASILATILLIVCVLATAVIMRY